MPMESKVPRMGDSSKMDNHVMGLLDINEKRVWMNANRNPLDPRVHDPRWIQPRRTGQYGGYGV